MAKTSEFTRRHVIPALLHNLENPFPEELPLIAKGRPDKSEIKEVGRLNYIFIKLLIASVLVDSMKCNAGV